MTLAKQAANQKSVKHLVSFPTDTGDLVRAVDGKRWRADLQMLVGFNRFSHGPGIANARDRLVESFSSIPGLEVSTDAFRLGSSTVHNVLARLPGTTRPNDVIIVGAHYDAISQSPQTAAPGAEDNGSGTAGLLELARVLAPARPAATILFIAYAGEEQGLNGSYDHVRKLRAAGQLPTIKAVFNMDMIAYTNDADFDCLLESDDLGSRTIFPSLMAAAAEFTTLRMVTSLNPWGSDHVPYIEAGVPALLTIDNDWDDYPAYHRTTDTIEKTSMPLAVEILKMQVAAIWDWAT
jgi:Zn-dependent M28 family amino/carboxypeptidase